MFDLLQLGVIFDKRHDPVAKTGTALVRGDDHVEYERLECKVGQYSGEALQVTGVIDDANANL